MPPVRNPQTQKLAFSLLAAVFLVFAVIAFAAGNVIIGVVALLFVLGNGYLAYKLHTLRT